MSKNGPGPGVTCFTETNLEKQQQQQKKNTLQTSPKNLLGQLKPNFIWSLHGPGERKLSHMIKMASMPIYNKKKKL